MNPNETIYAALTANHVDRTAEEIATMTSHSLAEVATGLQELIATGKVVAITEKRFVSDIDAKRLRDTAQKTLAIFHKKNPYKQGISIGDLHAALTKAATTRDFDGTLAWLGAAGILVREGKKIRSSEHMIVLPPNWQAAADTMLPVFAAGGLNDPPWPGNFRANFPRDIHVTVILDALSERGELIRLDEDLYIAVSAMEQAWETIQALVAEGEAITVGTLRDHTDSSRRVIVPLMEWFDARGLTIRQGETRIIAPT